MFNSIPSVYHNSEFVMRGRVFDLAKEETCPPSL